MATAKKAFGTKIYGETTPASGTFTELGGIENLTYGAAETEFVDSTTLGAASAFRTQVPTLNRLSDVTFDLFYDSGDATQEQLRADQEAQTARLYKIVAVDAGAEDWRATAFVRSFGPIRAAKDGLLVAQVTLAASGAPTRA